ncbi:MAG: DUF3106 domain-containing protein [Planctomycetes bacterium]|nr:DUF3106 domain-containing protein [Planctomycetota bacterium]
MSRIIHIGALLTIAAAVVVGATEPPAPRVVSVDQQLRLKRRLLMNDQSLLATLQENRRRWEGMSPSQQEQLRDRAYAFREADEAHRRQILDAWESFWRMDSDQRADYRRRAAWTNTVIAALTDAEKQRLLALPPADRARELLRLRERLTAEGLLPAEPAPATQPAAG